jgi:hypothetical protein
MHLASVSVAELADLQIDNEQTAQAAVEEVRGCPASSAPAFCDSLVSILRQFVPTPIWPVIPSHKMFIFIFLGN